LVLFKIQDDPLERGFKYEEGDYNLFLPDKGNRLSNWVQNYTRLVEEMGKDKPIAESYIDMKTGQLIDAPKGSFLTAERETLSNAEWTYNAKQHAWVPPPKIVGK
jgi:hypothetical protein